MKIKTVMEVLRDLTNGNSFSPSINEVIDYCSYVANVCNTRKQAEKMLRDYYNL